ncbi:MAG TPA: hypothetical protein DCF88_03420 [Plesiomonas shigelloides]|nr:hypothetical protein [Plesiomonas shigelloides]
MSGAFCYLRCIVCGLLIGLSGINPQRPTLNSSLQTFNFALSASLSLGNKSALCRFLFQMRLHTHIL